jgi:hypothetical protein
MNKRILSILFSATALMLPWRSFAAVMTVVPSPNDPDTILVQLDTQGQNINAMQANLTFDPSAFAVTDVSDGGSIVNFWVQSPAFSDASGTVSFAGIIPGGETVASGTVVTITIVPRTLGANAQFALASGQALLNDGNGTPANFSFVSAPFPLVPGHVAPPAGDTQAPDSFTPQIARDPNIFRGDYFVAFSTTDQGSGIARYDVIEVAAGTKVVTSSPWAEGVSSPYRLQDQLLSSDVYVRAMDKAGNFRIAEVPAEHAPGRAVAVADWIEIALGLVMLSLIGIWIARRQRHSA